MSRVAEYIEQSREHLVQRYLEEVGKLESARGLRRYELLGTLPEYLATLGFASNRARLEEMHITQRLRLGFTQEEVAGEYVLLGRLVSSLWEGRPRGEQPHPEEAGQLFAALQRAMDRVVAVFSGYSVEDRQREKRGLRRLDSVAAEVLETRDVRVPLRERLAPLLAVVQDAMGAAGAELYLVDTELTRLELAAATGCVPPAAAACAVPLGSPAFVAEVARTEDPLHLPDATLGPLQVRAEVRASGLRSLLGLRLYPQGRLLGVLYIGVGETRPFEPRARRYFETLLEHLSAILDRALLFERVREAEARYRMATQAFSGVVWEWDVRTGALQWTGGVEGLLGYRGEELGHMERWYAGIHPADRERVVQGIHAAVERGQERWEDEYRVLCKDGRTLHVIDHGVVERDAQGHAVRMVGAMRDITERKRVAEALRASELRYRRLGEAGIVGIVEWKESGAFTEANDTFLRMLGYSREDLQAGRLDFRALTPPDYREATEQAVRTLKNETGIIPPLEKQYFHRDGHPVDVLIASATLDAERTWGITLVLDISERKRAERALQRREEEFRSLAETMPQVVWTARPDGTIDYANQVLASYMGKGVEEVLGTSWTHVIHPDDVLGMREHWQQAVETAAMYEVSNRVRRHDGTYRWFLTRASPMKDAQGRVLRWFGTSTDIEDLTRAQEELRRRADFERQLIGIVSHDLRNPLNAILLSATTLLRRPGLDERQANAIGRIRSSGERALRLIRDLLDFTQARMGGGLPVQHQGLDLHDFTRQVVDEVRLAYPERELRVEASGDGRGEWDPDRLAQVLTNLVNNALAYSPPEAPVEVRTAGRDGDVLLEVHNGGAPIPPELLARLFQPFERGSQKGDRVGRSVGLGLFIVERIVSAHGGSIEVRSSGEEGTTFTVLLPRHALALAPEAQPVLH